MALKEFQNIESEHHQKDIEHVRSTRTLGRKRIAVPMEKNHDYLSSPFGNPLPERRYPRRRLNRLESLPQDILIKILCKATHADLKQLLLVSKSVNQATLIAKELHFVYCTPQAKRVFAKRDGWGFEDDLEAPGAPMRPRFAKSRLNFEKLDGISVAAALFTDYVQSNNGFAGVV